MKILHHAKDGGPESRVDGYWLIEWKRVFSIALLRFADGSRDSFHDHAFNAVSWLLTGWLDEHHVDPLARSTTYLPSFRPIVTRRSTFHRVVSRGTSWVLTFRGPWSKTWREYHPAEGRFATLAHGRKEVQP